MLFLKSLPANRQTPYSFQWPDQVGAIVESATWDPAPECGNGLHGLINGEGNLQLLNRSDTAIWYAFESIDEHGNPSDAETVAIDDEKGKCHRAIIRAIGTRDEATSWLVNHGCPKVAFANITVGDYQLASAGHCANVRSGFDGIAIGGHSSKATVAEQGIAITKSYGTSQSQGHDTIAISGRRGHATVEDCSIAIAGDDSTAKGAECSVAIAKNAGRATVGKESIAIVQHDGTATSGIWGISIGRNHARALSDNAGIALVGQFGQASAGINGIAYTEYGGTAITAECGTSIAGRTGTARTGPKGVAIAEDGGCVSGGEGSVLILYGNNDTPVVAIVGLNGIKPDTVYKLHDKENRFVEVHPVK